jgi:hypothetical protein
MGLNVETSYSTSNETKNMSMLEPHESHESKPLPQSTSPSNPAEETQHLDLKRSSPVSKTFETTELCEEILSHLSCLELWRARSTCKSFQQVIDHSPLLHKNAFLEPHARALHEKLTYQTYLDQHTIHPLLAPSLGPPLPQQQLPLENLESRFLKLDKPTLGTLFHPYISFDGTTPLVALKETSATGTKFAADSPFFKMYLCNPPPEVVRVSITGTFYDTHNLRERCKHFAFIDVVNKKGVTFGQVFRESKVEAVLQHQSDFDDRVWELRICFLQLWGIFGPKSSSNGLHQTLSSSGFDWSGPSKLAIDLLQ